MNKQMNKQQAEAIQAILVEHLNVYRSKHRPDSIRDYLLEEWQDDELRILGVLGFGCKLRKSYAGRVWVDYYPENWSTEGDALLDKVNALIVAARGGEGHGDEDQADP